MKATQVCLCCIQILQITQCYAGALQFSEGAEVSCPKGWTCSISEYKYNVKNPNTTAQLYIGSYMFWNDLEVKCQDIQLKDLERVLPSLRMTNYNTVKISRCPSSESFTVGQTLRMLGVARCNTFDFKSKYSSNSTALQYLPEINKLKVDISTNAVNGRIPEDLFSDKSLSNLKRLSFYSNAYEIPVNIFVNLENLTELDISNNLHRLSNGVFRHNRKLQHLWLNNNKLQNLNKDVFNGAESVIGLDLSYNGIEYLAGDIFEKLINVERINLKYNRLKLLPAELFKHNKNVVTLEMDQNKADIPSPPSALLANLKYLTMVSFSCGLTSVPGDLLANSSAITDVWIYNNNKLKTLPAELFISQTNLLNVALSNNSLKHLPENIFQYNVLMTHLYLNNNKFETISRKVFDSLERLQYVNLSNNLLHIDSSKFYLSFMSRFWLVDIRLSNNLLNEIPSDWISPRSLRDFDLSYNNISTLNTKHIKQLVTPKTKINLNNNKISRLDLQNFEMIEVPTGSETIIDLNDNPVECDCKLLDFLLYINGEKNGNLLSHIMFKTNRLWCVNPPPVKEQFVNRLDPRDLKCPTELKYCPAECKCHIRSYDNTLIVDCSQKGLNTVPNLSMIEAMNSTAVELNLENNELLTLPIYNAPGYDKVTKLLVAGNNLSTIEAQQLPKTLSHLDLRWNRVPTLSIDMVEFLTESEVLTTVLLSQNPWLCECSDDSVNLLLFIKSLKHKVADFLNITCSNTAELQYYYELQDLCDPVNWKAIALFGLTLIVVSLVAVYYKYEKKIKIWLYAHDLFPSIVTEHELDKYMTYDAFISYSHRDEEFVVNHLQPELENGHPPFKLCVHERDFTVGECIPDQIVSSIENSRRTIVVLSENFLESRWSRLEFKLAHEASLNDGRNRVIVIIYGDIGDLEIVDDDLKSYLKMKTYLKWDDPWFWKKLRYAMPHTVPGVKSKEGNLPLNSDRQNETPV